MDTDMVPPLGTSAADAIAGSSIAAATISMDRAHFRAPGNRF
ncbi:hypothetical protein [Sphingobium yanoikuyae]|nr:hypothetical protein [Sphingobium yanoikuyae]